ncbi:MAG: acetyl-CoA hydrolase, partial [Gammaproteobacteria bacterium]|nr:acetyl-CoA hydrolase [Gammaproteobacteria bacterium]
MSPDEAETLLEDCVERTLSHLGKRLVMGLPLGLGKPNALVNAFYRRARADPALSLEIVTALSLDPPQPGSDLEGRFLAPFIARHFGEDYPRLDYVADLSARRLPDNIRVTEFYLQSGSRLGNPLAQRRYVSSNYTHVARDLLDRGVNLALQLVAEGELDGDRRLSLSCNPDVTLELKARLAQRPEHRCRMIGQVHPELPFMHGEAVVAPEFFDEVLPATHQHRLFALPRTPVQLQDHWVGLHASRLVADGGTLQIGIGSLSDALVHALILRQRDNAAYLRLLGECDIDAEDAACRLGGTEPFAEGLYGASEMFMDGFMHLYRAGILRREVFDDEATQAQANTGTLPEALRGTGALMDGGFFLGSRGFYDFLQALDEAERPRFRMQPVSRINQLYGGNERLEIAQRQRARFINSCMMVTLTGGVVSDTLADHQVVSGVGGQYNFVAMAHAMD